MGRNKQTHNCRSSRRSRARSVAAVDRGYFGEREADAEDLGPGPVLVADKRMSCDWILREAEIQSSPSDDLDIINSGTSKHQVSECILFPPPQSLHASRTFSFDPKKRGPIIAAWTKFTTLIEITSLSTSPNQLRDATPDLRRLLDPTSPVPASWIIVLIALGFSSGSGGVSRVFWDFLASLENRRIARLFEGPEGRALLQDVIIPFAATASSFVVLRPTPDKCEHGTELAKWIGTILNAGDAEMRKQCGRAIMAWIDAKEDNVFVPARAWILKGLLDGVQGQTVFDAPEDLATFVRIGKMRRFTKMKVDVCVAIVLKLLLSVDAAKIGFAEFWDALAEVALKKEYLLSEEYVLALHERFGQALVGGGELQHLGRMTFVEEGESEPPSRKELLKAVLVMCCMSCWIRGFQVDIDTQMPRLSFWTVLHGNQQLFRCVARLFDGQAILPSILKAHADPTSDDGDLADLLQLWPVEAAEKGILGAMLKSRWAKLQEARGKKFEQGVEKQRANWAVICASCTRLLGECTLTVEETIVMVNSFDLPVLGRNKHDNIEMTATAGRFIGAMLRVLETAILESKAEVIVPEPMQPLYL